MSSEQHTNITELAVAELLEEEEKKALAKKATESSHHQKQADHEVNNGRRARQDDHHREPRGGHHQARGHRMRYFDHRDRYSSETDENDKPRSRDRKSFPKDATDDKKAGDDLKATASDVDSANGSVKSRRRSRSPGYGRYEPRDNRERYRDRRSDHHDDRDGGDYYRARRQEDDDDRYYRPSGRSRREDDRPPTRDRDNHRDERRDRRDTGNRRRSPDPVRKKSPIPTDDDRDRRTVFVQQLAARLRTKELIQFFQQVGPVDGAEIVKDRVSKRSKGVGYVEFRNVESIEKAMGLTGQKLLGIPVIVQAAEAEKNRQARANEGAATQSNGVPFHRLYVGNIHFSITEDDLKSVFESFGQLEFVQLQKEEGGRSKGYGFVQFADATEAKDALDKMNGFELAGRPIRVGLGNDKFTPESTQNILNRFGNNSQQQNTPQGSSFSGMGGRGHHAGGTANFDRAGGKDADKTGGASALDDTDVAGVNFSNYSRDALMRKLARTDETEQKAAPKAQPAPVEAQQPTRCVQLKNMYSEADTKESNWQKELEGDVGTECETKYGIVVHVGIDPTSHFGDVYVKFDRVEGGKNAIQGLNGRFFGGNRINASYVADVFYKSIFPKAANV